MGRDSQGAGCPGAELGRGRGRARGLRTRATRRLQAAALSRLRLRAPAHSRGEGPQARAPRPVRVVRRTCRFDCASTKLTSSRARAGSCRAPGLAPGTSVAEAVVSRLLATNLTSVHLLC